MVAGGDPRFIAEEPIPLPVDDVIQGDVGKEWARGVVGIEAAQVLRVSPVTVTGADFTKSVSQEVISVGVGKTYSLGLEPH